MVQISLVIPVYNAEETLGGLLRSISEQTLAAELFEVIAVDDGSTDRSAELVRTCPGIQLLSQKNRGPGAARNLGTRHARGAIIAYTDADCILPPSFLSEHLRLHDENKDIDGIHGGIAPANALRYGSCVLADHLCNWFWDYNASSEHEAEYMPSANMSIKRRVLEAGVCWSEKRITGEDVDLSLQMCAHGMRMRFFPGPYLYHVDRASLRQFLRHQYNWGFHAPFVRGSNKEAAYSFLFPASLWKAWLCCPLIIIGYTALVVGGWWRHRPVGLLSAMPLIVLGKIWYARGVLHGTKALVSSQDGIIADKREG
jgi:glycosyltransferase involved in cell wall biosynthesis